MVPDTVEDDVQKAWIIGACVAALALAAAMAPWDAQTARADEAIPKFDAKDLVPLVNGPNWVDLDGDGRPDLVMKSRFEIDSPHSFSLYTFHIYVPSHEIPLHSTELFEPGIQWYAVPFPELDPPVGKFQINSYQGADCMTHDLRLVIEPGRPPSGLQRTYVIVALRDPGESFADPNPVTFTVYRLERESPKGLGEFSFIQVAKFPAKRNYCSVISAFREELGLPDPDPADEGFDYNPDQP